uniref:G patch domain-containing protein 11 n=1 Tax=Strigamia maritima TaxID=126957 RepID=T1JL29_STRMM
MSDEDDDYMSDKFLPASTDVKPGLLFTHSLKTKFAKDVKQKISNESSKTVPKKVLEQQRRETGLQNALSVENKGFAMMQRMGYKPGTAIGKTGIGKTEPIAINLKEDRGGLGRDTLIKRKKEEKKKELENFRAKRIMLDEKHQKLYRNQMSNKSAERQMMSDLVKSQKACKQLDNEIEIYEPEQDYFWIKEVKESEEKDEDESDSSSSEDEDEEEQLEPSFMLEKITEYLRTKYKYCVWCGIKFEDEMDMSTTCPGNTYDDH